MIVFGARGSNSRHSGAAVAAAVVTMLLLLLLLLLHLLPHPAAAGSRPLLAAALSARQEAVRAVRGLLLTLTQPLRVLRARLFLPMFPMLYMLLAVLTTLHTHCAALKTSKVCVLCLVHRAVAAREKLILW